MASTELTCNAVLFDLDGVLVDSRRSIEFVWADPRSLPSCVSVAAPDHCPFVAPDESYLIWSSFRGVYGSSDLFISFRTADGRRSEPRNLGPRINSGAREEYPYVTPDGPGNIYWVDARAHLVRVR